MGVFSVRIPDSLIDRVKEAADGTPLAKWTIEAFQKVLNEAPAGESGEKAENAPLPPPGAMEALRDELEASQGLASSLKRDLAAANAKIRTMDGKANPFDGDKIQYITQEENKALDNVITQLRQELFQLRKRLNEVELLDKTPIRPLKPGKEWDPNSGEPHPQRPVMRKTTFDKAISVNPEFLNKILTSSRREK